MYDGYIDTLLQFSVLVPLCLLKSKNLYSIFLTVFRSIEMAKCLLQVISTTTGLKFEDLANKVLEINLLIQPQDFVGVKLAAKIASLYNYRIDDRAFKEEEVLAKKEISEEEL